MLIRKFLLPPNIIAIFVLLCLAFSSSQNDYKPVIIYDDAITIPCLEKLASLGASKYIIVYQNDCDPESQKTGVINFKNVAAFIIKAYGPNPEGWGILDFENPFDDFLKKDKNTPEYKNTILTMVECINKIKLYFPKVKWTYYGIPALPYYLGSETWATATADTKNDEIKRQLIIHSPILLACDWLAPSIYNQVGDSKNNGLPTPHIRASTAAWSFARTKMCVDFQQLAGKTNVVMPFVSPLYMPGGGAPAFSPIPDDIILQDTISPAMKAGATGFAIWTAGSYFIKQVTSKLNNNTEGEGNQKIAEHWSKVLGLPIEQIESPLSVDKLSNMIANKVSYMALEISKQKIQNQPKAISK